MFEFFLELLQLQFQDGLIAFEPLLNVLQRVVDPALHRRVQFRSKPLHQRNRSFLGEAFGDGGQAPIQAVACRLTSTRRGRIIVVLVEKFGVEKSAVQFIFIRAIPTEGATTIAGDRCGCRRGMLLRCLLLPSLWGRGDR